MAKNDSLHNPRCGYDVLKDETQKSVNIQTMSTELTLERVIMELTTPRTTTIESKVEAPAQSKAKKFDPSLTVMMLPTLSVIFPFTET